MCFEAFSPFPTMFSKDFFLKVVKSWDCVVKKQLEKPKIFSFGEVSCAVYLAFSPFITMFAKAIFLKVVKITVNMW